MPYEIVEIRADGNHCHPQYPAKMPAVSSPCNTEMLIALIVCKSVVINKLIISYGNWMTIVRSLSPV